jgi:UDP-N-acetylmuramate-alanine ligase
MQNFYQNFCLGESKYFVAELDESDGSFLYFYPHISVVTNIDYEHVDYYGNWHNILNAYRKFMSQTADDGLIVACGDDKNILDILKGLNKKSITYGLLENNDVFARDVKLKNLTSRFRCIYKGTDLGEVSLNIPGSHNIANALACICVAREMGIDFAKIKQVLSEFRGVQRRFQVKENINGITIAEDYGHHPTEISATLKAAKSADFKRIIVVFQPHRFTRTKFFNGRVF